ncbi:uncharacterized protein LOC106064424 [Biomphalaria glabrata]|uniref:Uncharacterized protein LOC106064424 n=1 Tax=Biomphalaria glabrata TaxID=6526 RepID=A0A9W2ZCI6_BIOGL|nr:uncharacterized protein LOC106064424 [Biomphalaria glabrata]
MVNCSAKDLNTAESTNQGVEINVNISQGNQEPGATDNIKATSKNLQSVGSVVQIVGDIEKLSSSNTDVLGNRLQYTGDENWTGLRNPGYDEEETANGDGQTVANMLQIGFPLNDDRTISKGSESRVSEIKADSGEGAKQTVVNSIQSRDDMEMESLKNRIKVLENNVRELWELANRPRPVTAQQNQQIDNISEESFMETTTERDGNATDIKSMYDQKKETELETLIHDVVSSCSELRADLTSNERDMKYELRNIFSRLDELESKMEDADPENVGTYRVTDEDIQGMFQEFENSLYK